MLTLQNEINEVMKDIPSKYLINILEYVRAMREMVIRGEQTDQEYIESIPGYKEMILRESSRDLKEYTKDIDW